VYLRIEGVVCERQLVVYTHMHDKKGALGFDIQTYTQQYSLFLFSPMTTQRKVFALQSCAVFVLR
jgi:hypothetical protein